ncbi:hypothetical protein CO038_04705 [Candidatus Pacearchaeota archaeon CG_4_9_14_0_2_um_filter_39_13]|nr:7-cyano-7-deazaguanine synthase [Candidatus Pacearchaeota archaeon]OIO42517.1 MAG: hypothetical protein AUJ64_03940 [Candidatus Pacearchaeota archaeon CG1_02_39_14]PJC44257.1 MAG: hypothetical protein CO038_04705 [Candidatus Pacearchaeota archaeon CG_4_9_14_0_2_um_filter_39_13]
MAKSEIAIVLCSGGLDSVVTAHYVKKRLDYRKIIVLFFDYGQKNLLKEEEFSRETSKIIGGEFFKIKLPGLKDLSDSLINSQGDAEKIENLKNTKKESDKFYVPCRNTIFLSYALALAESLYIREGKVSDIFVGFKSEGKEPFPDATPDFLKKLNSLSEVSCAMPFKVIAPFIEKDKEDLIRAGEGMGLDFEKTFSCYVGKENHCGTCLACRLRQEGFKWAGIKDPTKYLE